MDVVWVDCFDFMVLKFVWDIVNLFLILELFIILLKVFLVVGGVFMFW